MTWYLSPAKAPDNSWQDKARSYQNQLTKPPGSLGRLEDLAVQFSAWQNTLKPELSKLQIVIMAGDHGVAEEGISAFPQIVTGEMVKNFASGGAAISVLSRFLHAKLHVINLGTIHPLPPIAGVLDKRIGAGTMNICKAPAMSSAQLEQALAIGHELAKVAKQEQCQLIIGGEMGIGNTTPAACMAAKLFNLSAADLAGPGSGLNQSQLQHKITVIEKALAKHQNVKHPIDVLQCLGGFEIAGLVGLFIASAQYGIPVLIDGYIVSAAALIACAINPSVKAWLIASHCSAEPAHKLMLEQLQLNPLLDLSMRLGEGSGAAVCVPLIQAACQLQSQMATFSEAGVSEK